MKLVADKNGIKVIGAPQNTTRPNELVDFVSELTTQVPVVAKGDTLVLQYTSEQREIQK